jgi:TatD DNase family protein
MKYVDVHIHLSNAIYHDRIEAILRESEDAQVVSIVSSAEDYQTSLETLRISQKYPARIYAAIGIHPNNTQLLTESELDKTIQLIEENRLNIVAIGEIGLDRRIPETEIDENQISILNVLLQAAENLGLPVIIHSRGAASEVLEILPSYNISKVMLHWYSGSLDLIPKIIGRGYSLSVGPSILYAKYLQDIVIKVPLEKILTETDGPVSYRGPFKGRLTSPSFIPEIVNFVHDITRKDLEEISTQIFRNFTEFFSLDLDA